MTALKSNLSCLSLTQQALLDRLVASDVLTAYERDYELDKLCWYYDEMGGGTEGKRKKAMGAAPKPGDHYRSCVVTTGDTQVTHTLTCIHTHIHVHTLAHTLSHTHMHTDTHTHTHTPRTRSTPALVCLLTTTFSTNPSWYKVVQQ